MFGWLFGKENTTKKLTHQQEKLLLEEALEGEDGSVKTLVLKYFNEGHSAADAISLAQREQSKTVKRMVAGGEALLEMKGFGEGTEARKQVENGIKEGKAALYDYEKDKKDE